jgi:hypothetical protein
MAEKLVSGDRCTARAACRHFGLNRSTYAYRAKEADAWEAKLKGALRRKSNEHPELGYAKITRLLKQVCCCVIASITVTDGKMH